MSAILAAVGTAQDLQFPSVEYSSILPILIFVGAALLLLLVSSLMRDAIPTAVATVFSAAVGVFATGSVYFLWRDLRLPSSGALDLHSTIAGAIALDRFGLYFVALIGVGFVLSVLLSHDWLEINDITGTEYYALMMIAASGAMMMALANDLMVVFLGLEVLSLALYVLVGFDRFRASSKEAALKYFLLGGFSSAILLFGIALTYGAVGSTNLANISAYLATNVLLESGLLLGGIVLMTVGFAFKVAAVPFHQWAPDVYQGAPTPVTGFMATVAKAAAFAAFLRVLVSVFETYALDWKPVIASIAVATLLVGAIAACVQRDIKRMLAYSSISHVGFMLLGLYAADQTGAASSLYYLLIYLFMAVGSFGLVLMLEDEQPLTLESIRGLAQREPALAVAFAVLLFAQAGVPLTTGFLAKFYVLTAVVDAHSYWLAVLALLAAAIAAFFYLRVIVAMFGAAPISDGVDEVDVVTSPELMWGTSFVVVLTVLVTIVFGVLPSGDFPISLLRFARDAASDLFATSR